VVRPHLALAAAALLAVLAPAAHAEKVPVLDGKGTKTLSLRHDTTRGAGAPNGPTDAQVLSCGQADCGRLDFLYKPGKGVKRDLGMQLSWYYAGATRIDLFLVGGGKVVARCAGSVANTRYLLVPGAALKSGQRYTAVMYYDYSFGEKGVVTVTLPAHVGGQGPDASDKFNPKYAACSS
jgi:hypothetical protein